LPEIAAQTGIRHPLKYNRAAIYTNRKWFAVLSEYLVDTLKIGNYCVMPFDLAGQIHHVVIHGKIDWRAVRLTKRFREAD